MDFDFYAQYRTYSIPQLLGILHDAHQYQEAAVAAARVALDERDPADVEAERARLYPAPKPEQHTDVVSVFDEWEPMYNPLHVLLLRGVVIAIYLYYCVNLIYVFLPLLGTAAGSGNGVGSAVGLMLPVAAVGLYLIIGTLLLLKKPAGWYIAMVLAIFDLILRTGMLIQSQLPSAPEFGSAVGVQLFTLLLAGVVVFVLWTPAMRDAYKIPDRAMRNTVGWASAVSGGILVLRMLLG